MARNNQKRQDAIAFLKGQHDTIRELFRSVAAAEGEARREAFRPLVRLLAVHETAEEIVIYPALRRTGDEGKRIADARIEEEDESKKMLADLETVDPASSEFAEPFAKLRTAVESHADKEEHEVFPLLAERTDERMLTRMTGALQVAEGVAPTHAHRSAPKSAAGNMLIGPFVGIADRTRDAIRAVARH